MKAMKIRDSYCKRLLSVFRYSDFRDASETSIRNILTGNFPKSELPLIMLPDRIQVETVSVIETDVTFIWDDNEFKFRFNWKLGDAGNYILTDIT